MISVIDGTGSVGAGSSLCFAPDGQPAVSYYDSTNGNLKYARYSGTAWVAVTTRSTASFEGDDTTLAFGPNGQPAISNVDSTANLTQLAIFNGTAWTFTTIGYRDPSFAFGPDGQPAFTFHNDLGGRKYLEYGRYDGSTWIQTVVDQGGVTGLNTCLAFGPDGQPAIAYYDETNGDLRFARKGIFKPKP